MCARRADYRSRIPAGMMAEIVIRQGREPDKAFARELGLRTMADSVAPFRTFVPALLEASYENLLDFVFAQSHIMFVAELAGRGVAFLLMLDSMPDEVTQTAQGFIAYMAVEPSARRCGIATRLLTAAENEARSRGLPYMGLMVTETNAAARALYERAGYLTERRLLCKPL